MSEICIKAEGVAKCFQVSTVQRSTFRLVKALLFKGFIKRNFWALKGIDLELFRGQRLALLGNNGSGKTTLLRVLSSIYSMTSGSLYLSERPGVFFNYSIGGSYGDLDVAEAAYILGMFYGIDKQVVKNQIDDILKTAEIEEFKFLPFKDLSLGQMRRLSWSVFLKHGSRIIFLDEAFASLDQVFSDRILGVVQQSFLTGRSAIIASHNTKMLRQLCDSAVWLDAGRIKAFGPAAEVIDSYEKNMNR